MVLGVLATGCDLGTNPTATPVAPAAATPTPDIVSMTEVLTPPTPTALPAAATPEATPQAQATAPAAGTQSGVDIGATVTAILNPPTSTPVPTNTPDVKVAASANSVITESLLVEINAAKWMQEPLTISPDLRHIGYISAYGARFIVIHDATTSPDYVGILENSLTFSPDSKRFAFGAIKGPRQLVVVDGVEGGKYASI